MDTPDQIAKVRAQFKKITAPLARPVEFTGKIENRLISGPAGDLPVRIYTPLPTAGADTPVLLVYLHRGKFIVGDPDLADAVTRFLGMKTPAGLPPTIVITAGFDPLSDEAKEYADALAAAGVSVRYVNEPEMLHGFITMNRICREARLTFELTSTRVRVMGKGGTEQS